MVLNQSFTLLVMIQGLILLLIVVLWSQLLVKLVRVKVSQINIVHIC
jgi:hypothetical protein